MTGMMIAALPHHNLRFSWSWTRQFPSTHIY